MPDPIRPSTSQAIITAAFELLNVNPRASLSEIAAAAGVGRATLHRHFNGREDLIRTLALQGLAEMDQAAEQASENTSSYGQALYQIFYAMIPLGDRHWFLAQEPIQTFPDVQAELQRQQDDFMHLIEGARGEGFAHPSCPAAWIAASYDHLIHAAWEMIRADQATHSQAADLAWATLTQGLKRAKITSHLDRKS